MHGLREPVDYWSRDANKAAQLKLRALALAYGGACLQSATGDFHVTAPDELHLDDIAVILGVSPMTADWLTEFTCRRSSQ